MKRILAITAILFPILTFGETASVQPSFQHLSIDEGLSSASANDICIDDKGVVWIATRDGFDSFDGRTVRNFRPGSASVGCEVGNIVERSVYDGGDKFYLLLADYLSVFDRRDGSFRNIPCDKIGSIVIRDSIYVSHGSVISIFSEGDGTFRERLKLPDGLSVSSLAFQNGGGENKLWIGTKQDGLYLSTDWSEPEKVLDAGKVADIYCDSKNQVWICTWTSGLYRIGTDGAVSNYRHSASDKNSVSSDFVRTCCEDGDGNLWIGSIKGLDRMDASSGRITRVRSNAGAKDALSNTSIWKLRRDRQGNIWVATYYGGVNWFNPEVRLFTCLYPSPFRNDGLSNPIVGRIYGDGPDGLWICTEAGFNHYDINSGEFIWYGVSSDGDTALEHVKALWHDRGRRAIWAGADMGGLFRVPLGHGEMKAFYHDPDDPSTIPGNRVRDIIPYRNDSLIVATQSGLCVFSVLSGKARRILEDHPEIRIVTDVSFGPSGHLWIVESNGLYRYDIEAGTLVEYSGEPSPGKFVSCTFFDADGDMWVGTFNSGLYRYDSGADSFRHIPLDGVSGINAIGEITTTGDLVISTSGGICLYNPKSGVQRSYDTSSGYPFRSTSENSLYISTGGIVFVGSSHGLVTFDAENIYRSPRRFDVIATGFAVNGKVLQVPYGCTSLSVKSGSTVSVELTTTNYIPSDLVNLEYRISGSGKWNPVGGRIDLTDLKAGTYVLTVRDRGIPEAVCPPLVITVSVSVRVNMIVSVGIVALLVILILFQLYLKRKSPVSKDASEENLTPSQRLYRRAKEVVEANLDNSDFNVSAFSSEMGMSRTVLFQKIKEATDKTPNEFILQIRLEEAVRMLEKDTDLNVAEISQKTGFGSQAYFSQKFKENFGMSPLAWRKKQEAK